jgi:hypothetical protein
MPIALHVSGNFVIYCENFYQDIHCNKCSEYTKQQFGQVFFFFFFFASKEYIQLFENSVFKKIFGPMTLEVNNL